MHVALALHGDDRAIVVEMGLIKTVAEALDEFQRVHSLQIFIATTTVLFIMPWLVYSGS